MRTAAFSEMNAARPESESDEATRAPPRLAKQAMASYFAYGSNIHLVQMAQRCPSSVFRGKGTLAGYRWQINQRGVANIVPCTDAGCAVEGLVYSINAKDEKTLDRSEGVAKDLYQKCLLKVALEPHRQFSGRKTAALSALLSEHGDASKYEGVGSSAPRAGSVGAQPASLAPDGLSNRGLTTSNATEQIKALVYVSENYTDDGDIRQEYIGRMQNAVADALKLGISRSFVDGYIWPHLNGSTSRNTTKVTSRKLRTEPRRMLGDEMGSDPASRPRRAEMQVTREQGTKRMRTFHLANDFTSVNPFTKSSAYILVEQSREVSPRPDSQITGRQIDVELLKQGNRQLHPESSLKFSVEMLDSLIEPHAADLGGDGRIFNVFYREECQAYDIKFGLEATAIDLELANELAMMHFREACSQIPGFLSERYSNWIRSDSEQYLPASLTWHLDRSGCLRLSATSPDRLEQRILWVAPQVLIGRKR